MSQKPQNTSVMIGQRADGRWCILLSYDDGEEFVSNDSWSTEQEAKRAADDWVLANAVPGRLH